MSTWVNTLQILITYMYTKKQTNKQILDEITERRNQFYWQNSIFPTEH